MSQWMPLQQTNMFMPQGMGSVQAPMLPEPFPTAPAPQSRFQKPPKPDEKKPMMPTTPPGMQMLPSMSMSMSMPFMPMQLSPDEKAAMDASREKIMSLMAEQRNKQQGQIQQMRQALNEYKAKPRGMDFTGGFMLADMLTKNTASPTSLTYQYLQSGMRPESEQQKMGNILDMENRIATQQDKAMQNEVDLAKEHMKALQDKAGLSSQLRYMSRLRGQDLSMKRFWENEQNDAQKEIFKFTTKMTGDATEQARMLDQLDGAFQMGDYQSVISNLANFARTVSGEKGVLTDQDIARVMPKNWNAGVAKFFSSIGEIPTADLPADYTAKLRELLDLARRRYKEKYERAISAHQEGANSLPYYQQIKPYTDNTYQIHKDKISEMFGGEGADNTANEDPMSTIKAIRDELARRKAGK